MTISLFGRSIRSFADRDTEPAATIGEPHVKRDSGASPLPLRGLSPFERLRKALPQPRADSLLGRLVSLPSTRGSAADAAASPVDQTDVGAEFPEDIDSLLGTASRSILLSRAMRAEAGRDEQASRAVIETVLDMCEAGNAVLDDELAGITFRLIASLKVTPRDRLLDRALDVVCSDGQLKLSPQSLMSHKWRFEERVTIHARMHTAVMAMPDTPERAARLGAVISCISRFEPSDQPAAIKKAWDAIDDTNMANRFVPLTQLRDLAIYLPTGAERGRLLLDLRKLDGDWLRACRTEDNWRGLFPDPDTLSPELIDA